MKQTLNAHTHSGCGRQEELVTYLYGEAGPAERAAFERHLEECAACRRELEAFKRVRDDLNGWQVPFVPHLEIAPRRSRLEVLRELLGSFPVWARAAAGLATAVAVVLVVLAGIGTRVSVGSSGVAMSFGRVLETKVVEQRVEAPPAQEVHAQQADVITHAEAEALIKAAVERAQAQAQGETRAQLASLEARLSAAHQAKLMAVATQLRAQQRAELAKASKQRPTISEWLFAASESNDSKNTPGTDGEKNE